MKLGVTVAYARNVYSSCPTLEHYVRFVHWASESGFEGFELAAFNREHLYSEFGSLSKIAALKSKFKQRGIVCDAFEAGFCRHGMVDPSKEARERTLQDFGKAVEVAQRLDTEVIYVHSVSHPSWKIEWHELYDEYSPPTSVKVPAVFSWEKSWEEYSKEMMKYTELAEKAGLRLALEIRPFEIVTNADGMLRLLDSVGSKSLGVVFDTGHFFVQKEILPIAMEKLKEHIFLVHLSDNDGVTDYHWAPGRGKIEWQSVIETLKKVGYRGFANIDVAGTYDDVDAEIQYGKDHILKLVQMYTNEKPDMPQTRSCGSGSLVE